jgi:hypothetical protein
MAEANLATVCGIYCGRCSYLGEACSGCSAEKGRVFWTRLDEIPWDVCPIWKCCIEERGLEHCGLCPDLPCDTYLALKDPDDPQADLHKRECIESLKHRAEVGTTRWLEEQESLPKSRSPSATD